MLLRKTFSLIELLIVIAIIAILMSLLQPALKNAMTQARIADCMSRLKNVSLAVQLHNGDNKERYPASRYQFAWGFKASEYAMDTDLRPFNEYINPITALSCPDDQGAEPGRWNRSADNLYKNFGYSYLFNSGANCNNVSQGLYGKPENGITDPSMMVVTCDYSFQTWGWIDELPGDYFPFNESFWHNEGELAWGNVLFHDGHVSFLQATFDKPNWQQGEDYNFRYDLQ